MTAKAICEKLEPILDQIIKSEKAFYCTVMVSSSNGEIKIYKPDYINIDSKKHEDISHARKEIIPLYLMGLTVAQICNYTGKNYHNVDAHIQYTREKINCHSRNQMIRYFTGQDKEFDRNKKRYI